MLSKAGLASEVKEEERSCSAFNTISLMQMNVHLSLLPSSLICLTIVRDVHNFGNEGYS